MSATNALNEYTMADTRCTVWQERDRIQVILYTEDQTLLEYSDEDVINLVEDGFLDPKNWHGSMLAYYNYLNS